MPRNKKHVRVFSWQESGDYVVRQRLCTIQITFDLNPFLSNTNDVTPNETTWSQELQFIANAGKTEENQEKPNLELEVCMSYSLEYMIDT